MGLSMAEFLTSLLGAVSLYYPESGNHTLQPADTPQANVNRAYDFVIVGAGSAGYAMPEGSKKSYRFLIQHCCVLANRLSENPDWQVLLIEAGGDEDFITETPRLHIFIRESDKDWNYTTVKQDKACLGRNGVCKYPRGKVMGGSSTINAMMYVRGNRADYNEWAAEGAHGWSYNEVLPYFTKSENITVPELCDSPYHGRGGYLNVGHARYNTPLVEKIIQAGTEFGWELGDYNGEKQEVLGVLQSNYDGPSRASTSKSFLNTIRSRTNLSVIKHARATKLIIKGNIANGVEYFRDGTLERVFARKEVIVSAGAIDTPKLLMLSGIGPKRELLKHNLPIRADLPVGENLKDHLLLPVYFEISENLTMTTDDWKSEDAIREYTIERNGPLTTSGAEVQTFLNVLNKTEPPNLQVIFFGINTIGLNDFSVPTMLLIISNVNPRSTGTLKLRSNKWTDPPLIDPNYFDEPVDFEVFEKGIDLIMEFMRTPTMAELSPKFFKPFYTLCPESNYRNQKLYIECIIKNYSGTIYHPVSTAKMGPVTEINSVVSPDLLVKGFKNLRVIDASVMRTIPRGNTNAPTIMVAEKGADIIKQHHNAYV